MTTLLASLILLAHAPIVQGPGGPGGGYALMPWSPSPSAIAASISGPSQVAIGKNFVIDVTYSDSDTFAQSYNGPFEVHGTAPVLAYAEENDSCQVNQDGTSADPVFVPVGQPSTPSSSDSSITKETIYKPVSSQNVIYPVYRQVKYMITDNADLNPPNGHSARDSPGFREVTKTIQVGDY